jgi:Tol biopolymer transport system component
VDLHVRYPAWNPSSSQIAFIGEAIEDKTKRIYVAEPDAKNAPFITEATPITQPMDATLIEWSPQGSYLVFYAWDEAMEPL